MIGDVRRRCWTTERKLQIIEESYAAGETVSSAARRHGVVPNLLYRWRRLLSEGGAVAVDSDEPVIGNSEVKKLEDRVRELERILGRRTLENEIFGEALSKAQSKKPISRPILLPKDVPDEDGGRCSGRGQPFHGFHGNAGELSGIYNPDESEKRPALQYLLSTLQKNGIDIRSVEALYRQFVPEWPGVEDWLAQTMPQVDRLVATLISVLDPQAIVFGGQLPRALGQMMIERVRMPSRRQHRYGVGPKEARLVLSETEGDPSVIGAALLPLRVRYFV